MITIRRLDIYHVRLPLKQPWVTALGTESAVETVLIHAYSDHADAWTETCPLATPTYSPECASSVIHMIEQVLAPIVLGKPIASGAELQALLSPIRGNPFAKAGLDTAWWALSATEQKKSLVELIGGQHKAVPYGEGVSLQADVERTIEALKVKLSTGAARVKIKIAPSTDIALIEQVREALPDARLFVDCNGSFTSSNDNMFTNFDSLNLDMIEQPFSPPDIADHAGLQKKLATSICLDESITSVDDAERAIRHEACRVINVKIGRVGGLTNALEIAKLCREHSVDCWVGSMLESGIGASMNLALATHPAMTMPSAAFYPGRYHKEDVLEQPLKPEASSPGTLRPHEGTWIGNLACQKTIDTLAISKRTIKT